MRGKISGIADQESNMAENTRLSRLPLRDLLHHAEHRCRELMEHLQMDLTPAVAELHRLTRPKRKKSSYPSVRSVSNVYERMRRSNEYAKQVQVQIEECVHAIENRVAEVRR